VYSKKGIFVKEKGEKGGKGVMTEKEHERRGSTWPLEPQRAHSRELGNLMAPSQPYPRGKLGKGTGMGGLLKSKNLLWTCCLCGVIWG